MAPGPVFGKKCHPRISVKAESCAKSASTNAHGTSHTHQQTRWYYNNLAHQLG